MAPSSLFRFLLTRIRDEFLPRPDEFDREFGIETSKTVWRKRLWLRKDSHGYQATSPEFVRRAFTYVPRFTFVDLGCGKGRVLVLADHAGFKKIIGVELSRKMVVAARANLERLRIPATIIHGDAGLYQLPTEPCVVFMYNPFGPTLSRPLSTKSTAIRSKYIQFMSIRYMRTCCPAYLQFTAVTVC
jgi:SAM-dependent methyltransferase